MTIGNVEGNIPVFLLVILYNLSIRISVYCRIEKR
jgi:hypothetical protein